MSASFSRPSPVCQQIVDSLIVTPPDSIQFWGMLKDAATSCGYVARDIDEGDVPSDEALAEVEQRCTSVALAIAAIRGSGATGGQPS
jgi:hypothetical protein